MREFLLAGGSGFMGRHVARGLVARGHHVTVLSRGRRDPIEGATMRTVDRRDPESVVPAVRGRRFDLTVDFLAYDAPDLDWIALAPPGSLGVYVMISTGQVYLVGEVEWPGAYQVSAVATVFNALYRAGGPTRQGSFRRIEVRRGGRVVGEVDLYDYLLRGDSRADIRLEQGDIIFVPMADTQVLVEGAVRRPAIYELRPDEGLRDLLAHAGGLKYQFKPGETYVYSVSVVGEFGPATQTTKGTVQLTVKSADGNQLQLTPFASLGTTIRQPASTGKKGPKGGPGGPFAKGPGGVKLVGPREFVIDPFGKVLKFSGETSLPLLMGTVEELVVELAAQNASLQNDFDWRHHAWTRFGSLSSTFTIRCTQSCCSRVWGHTSRTAAQNPSAPSPIGLSAYEACQIARLAGEFGIEMFDIVEVSPPYDADGRTCRLAARMIAYFLAGLAERKNLV